jgi:Family of unknown function (DUF5996)
MERVTGLPPLAFEEWNATRVTLRLFLQMVGKIRLALAPPRNHWWHVVFYVTPRGLTTGLMPTSAGAFAIDFDFVDHELVVRTDRGQVETIALRDGLSVAAFYEQLFALLARLRIEVEILAQSYGDPTPISFTDDMNDASYDADAVERFWRILSASAVVLEEFAGWFDGKTSPVHLFWHSLDLAVTRFSGRRAPDPPTSSFVNHEAYTHEVISFGFWAGDDSVREPTYYSYTYPEPPGLAEQPLEPEAARWVDLGSSHQARIPYEDVRAAESPRAALLAFLQSGYEAGARTAGWPMEELVSTWAPKRSFENEASSPE